jgi:hypothetical protein
MLNHVRSLAGVPKQGTDLMQIFTQQFANIAPRSGVASQGIMDDTGQYGYRFGNASMTESCRVEVGPLPSLPEGAWGKEPN